MAEKRQTSKIFVGGLSWETTDQRLRTYFENYGAVSEAFVSFDRATGARSCPARLWPVYCLPLDSRAPMLAWLIPFSLRGAYHSSFVESGSGKFSKLKSAELGTQSASHQSVRLCAGPIFELVSYDYGSSSLRDTNQNLRTLTALAYTPAYPPYRGIAWTASGSLSDALRLSAGRPRGFGFVVFEDPAIADKVVSLQHTIDRRDVRPSCTGIRRVSTH